MKAFEPRDRVVSYLKSVVEGPRDGDQEEIDGTPFLRYMTGILFPIGVDVAATSETVTATAEEQIVEGAPSRDESHIPDASVDLTAEALPSAVGLSFKVHDSAAIKCGVWGARYEAREVEKGAKGRAGGRWRRQALARRESPEFVVLTKSSAPVPVLGGLAKLTTRWRTQHDGTAIVTIALVNCQVAPRRGPDIPSTLFQVGIRCEVPEAEILPYPTAVSSHGEETEEAEIELLYEGVQPFARGHGAAANWGFGPSGACDWVETDFVPSVDVPKATFDLGAEGLDQRYCELDFLIQAPQAEVIGALKKLVAAYERWVDQQRDYAQDHARPNLANRFVGRAEQWVRRMRAGTLRLEDNELAWRCFRLANEAMAKQMVLAKSRPKVPYPRSERRSCPQFDYVGKRWRPFQIAFLLASIDALVNDKSQDRATVDVLWFPTGGGKTEAYLLLSAFELVRRRIVHGDRDTATAIFSRYTLRFLTAQQFQRTAALVIALELMRREMPGVLGARSFSLGLWVGRDATPNSYRVAHEKFEAALEKTAPENPFLLQACPCCGTEIFPNRPLKRGARRSRVDFGVEARVDGFKFLCRSDRCEFASGLPLEVVDEALYSRPPSILLGTIDKFAVLPWSEKGRVFFGGVDDHSPPPSLILQDELHLISGPLGSLAAPYDAAIDTIIGLRGGVSKRIGSTATIRNAGEQVRGLYGRDVSVFPPSCGSWDNAFFFSTEREESGRTYVGVMGQGYIKPVVAMAWTAAALLQGVKETPLDAPTLDAYWTLLAYHNSKRELGRTMTAARDEVQARIKAIASSDAFVRVLGEPFELSANMVKSMGEAMEALEQPHSQESPAIDFVPCTSIISVGVDVDRLGLMLMNGQPKLTSEYIQATSRVGRGSVPGLVVSLFSATKPRDRSHYEDFRAYHESIYRFVEPTSVTPYALPARERTIHAALVSLIRHATRYKDNASARAVEFESSDIKAAILCLVDVMCRSDPAEADEIRSLMSARIDEWQEVAESGMQLLYERRQAGHQFKALLAEYGKAQAGACWPTMTSVRNVDQEVRIKVL